MAAKFVRLESIDQLDALFERSLEHPVAIFKHSNSCGISSHLLELATAIDGEVHVVVIQKDGPLSNEIAVRTGHRHQSPQAFVIKNGRAVYHATHYGIDPKEIERQLKL